MERQIQQDAWGSARIAHVSQQCIHKNWLIAWKGTVAT